MSSIISRRTFLKGGMAAAALAVSGPAARAAAPADGKTQLATLVDISRCVGCEACVDACVLSASVHEK